MNEPNKGKISEQESFELAFQSFIAATRILTEDAETQCQKMGNYNTAWELKDDVASGAYMFNLPSERLSKDQKDAILGLIKMLDAIPANVLVSATTAVDNLKAMKHSCWIPLRKEAAKVIQLLQSAIRRNEAFFNADA